MRWLDGITDSVDMNLGKFWKTVQYRKAWHAAVPGIAKSQTWLNEQQPQEIPHQWIWGGDQNLCIK